MIEVAPKSFLGFGKPIFAVHLLNTQHLLNGNELSPPKHRNLYSLNMIIESNGRGSEAKLLVSETSPQNCSLHRGRSLRDEFRLREDVTVSQKWAWEKQIEPRSSCYRKAHLSCSRNQGRPPLQGVKSGCCRVRSTYPS